jgi:hypothetical protein
MGPVVEEHNVTPALPLIAQLTVPAGAVALLEPVTLAVKSKEPPRVVDPVSAREMAGVATATTVEFEVVIAATEKYAASPPKAKVA